MRPSLLSFFLFFISAPLLSTPQVEMVQNIREEYHLIPKNYPLNPAEPIDVIIPCARQDLYTLRACIEGIKKNGIGIRRVIIVSKEPMIEDIEGVEWFSEAHFPFDKSSISYEIFGSMKKAKDFVESPLSRAGWILQQLLKLYSPFVIPDISSNVLVLDADVVFLAPTRFLTKEGGAIFHVGTEYHEPYFSHMKRALPYLQKVFPQYSGVAHHMLFQRPILADFLSQLKELHQEEPWKVLCHCIDQRYIYHSTLSEYEMYFNFTFLNTDQCVIEKIPFKDMPDVENLELYRKQGLSFACCHHYVRSSKHK